MNREQQIDDALEALGEKLDDIAEIVSAMPIRGKVKDIMLLKLVDWNEELNDAITLSPVDW